MRILVTGSTGNTGVPLTRALSKAGHEVVAITRDPNKESSKVLAALPGVRVTTLSHAFDQPIERAFMAFAVTPDQFIEETDFIRKCHDNSVKYIVKISTYSPFMETIYSPSAYGRSHIAVEHFLDIGTIPFTTIRPNLFFPFVGVELDKIKKTKSFSSVVADYPLRSIAPGDIGLAAASLLCLDDPSPHFGKKYVLDGPEALTGRKIAEYLTEVLNEKITYNGPISSEDLAKQFKAVGYENRPLLEGVLETSRRIAYGEGDYATAENLTSPPLLSLAPPQTTYKDWVQQFFTTKSAM